MPKKEVVQNGNTGHQKSDSTKSWSVLASTRELYFNRRTKKAFSVEFVEDHSEDELQRHLSENKDGAEWRFYFNSPPSEAVKRELKSVLE